jgi:hypothetical protein
MGGMRVGRTCGGGLLSTRLAGRIAFRRYGPVAIETGGGDAIAFAPFRARISWRTRTRRIGACAFGPLPFGTLAFTAIAARVFEGAKA